MAHGMLWLRCLSIAVQSGCLVALARRRLARSYPAFWVFTLFGVLHSVWALGAGDLAGYDEAGTFRWALVALYGAVAIEACMAQARHFRSLFSFVIGGVVVFAVLSGALGATVCLMGAEVLRDGGPVTVMCSACCLLLILSSAFFRTFPVTMRANVRWHVLLLEVLLASAAVAAGLGSAESSGARLAAQLLTAAVPPICYALWTIKLVPSGECFLPLSQIPAEVLARLVAAEPRPVRTPQAPRSPSPRAVRTLRWKPDIAPSDADPEI